VNQPVRTGLAFDALVDRTRSNRPPSTPQGATAHEAIGGGPGGREGKAGALPLDPTKGRRPLEPRYWAGWSGGGRPRWVTGPGCPLLTTHPLMGSKGAPPPFAGPGQSPGLAFSRPQSRRRSRPGLMASLSAAAAFASDSDVVRHHRHQLRGCAVRTRRSGRADDRRTEGPRLPRSPGA